MTDPDRLLHGDDASERALLESLRADAPSEKARAGMWKGIAAQAAVGAAASLAPTKVAAALLPKALAAKVAVVVAIGAMGAGAAYWQAAREAPPSAAAPRRAVVEPRTLPRAAETCSEGREESGCTDERVEVASPPPEPPPVEAPSSRAPPREAPKMRAPKPVPRAPAIAFPVPPAPATPKLDALQAESRMLVQARAQLRAHDLAGAERTLAEARDRFEQGALGQEREVLQIELLVALGDRDGAEHRARRFLRKHPDSPHAKSVQRYLVAP